MIYFKKKNRKNEKEEENVEYYLKPDVVIAENGLGAPKYEIKKVLAPASNAENGEPPLDIGIDS